MKRMTLEEVKAAVIDAIAVSAICGRAEVELSWTAEGFAVSCSET